MSLRNWSTTDANASLTSITAMSSQPSPAFASARSHACGLPWSMRYGSTPAIPNETNRARGSRPSRPSASSLTTSIAAAPSTIALELPAVTLPSSLKAGASEASFSSDVSRRGFSSTATRTAAPAAPTSTGTISRSKRPSSIAAIARRCDSYE